MVRRILYLLVVGMVAFACSSPPPSTANAQLDQLFTRLRTTASAEEAQAIQVTIQHVWSQHRDGSVRTLMRHGLEAVHRHDFEAALIIMDEVVRRAPDFAEGWFLRASLNAARGDYPRAIHDIERVLVIEPRHFEALAGLGRIFLMLEDKKAALWAFEAALAINPHMKPTQEMVVQLRDSVIGMQI